jgi:signal transduction histidine kinase
VDSLADGGLADPERAATYLNFIRGENERLSRLVENFLTFSRIEGDRMTFDFHVVHPEDVAEEVKNAATERCLHSGCRFIYTADPELPLINADTSALTTVLVNLIDNSIKYSREDKEIQFRVSKEGSSVLFTVTDNGIGMSEQTIRRLGEKFYRDRAAVRSGRGGFGLGLHIVHSIVAAHDGKVRIESTPGVGTRIIVAIPGTLETNL